MKGPALLRTCFDPRNVLDQQHVTEATRPQGSNDLDLRVFLLVKCCLNFFHFLFQKFSEMGEGLSLFPLDFEALFPASGLLFLPDSLSTISCVSSKFASTFSANFLRVFLPIFEWGSQFFPETGFVPSSFPGSGVCLPTLLTFCTSSFLVPGCVSLLFWVYVPSSFLVPGRVPGLVSLHILACCSIIFFGSG